MRYLAIAIVSLFVLVSEVNATVISIDDVVFGIDSITVDTDQGLEFLDLTLSVNRSFNDISTQFSIGGDFEGFRHATVIEVELLINNFGIVFDVEDVVTHFPGGAFPIFCKIKKSTWQARCIQR